MRSTITQTLSFRAGHVVVNPHVHDFTLTVTVTAPLATSGPTAGMGADIIEIRRVMTEQVAHVLGHRMSTWTQEDPEVLARPVDWPKDIAGPELPVLPWAVRPTVENVTFWATGQVAAALRDLMPDAVVDTVELRETPRSSAIVTGADVLACIGAPGPVERTELRAA